MKARISLLLLCLPLLAFAQPIVLKGPHYAVTSWAGPEAGKATLGLMEGLLVRYNSVFLFDVSRTKNPWNVVVYSSKEEAEAALAGQTTRLKDFVYLEYADPAKSQLVAWVSADGLGTDQVRSLAFQGFYQFLWTFIPHPPAWIEIGLANVFWNSQWDGTTVTPNPDLPLLEALQKKWSEKAPDVASLLSAPSGSLGSDNDRDLEAWGLAAFLLETPEPSYARLLGAALAELSPTATEEVNRTAVGKRFQASKDLTVLGADVQAFWKARLGFAQRLAEGNAQYAANDLAGARRSFQEALNLRPKDNGARYLCGLTAYESKDYTAAEAYFAQVDGKSLPPGLLAYARGLTAFALKNNPDAKTWLEQAKAEDAATYEKLVAPVLELIK